MARPQHRDLFDTYFETIYARSNTLSPEEFEANARILKNFYGRFLPENRAVKILDVGCGCGGFLYFLGKEGYTDIQGIDLSPGQIAFCTKQVTPHARVADAFEYLQDKAGTYDLIVSNDTLEHVPKTATVDLLKLMHAALKPGGQLLLKVPNAGNPFALYIRYKDFTHECSFTDISLYQVLATAGFSGIDLAPSYAFTTFRERFLERPFILLLHAVFAKLYWWQGFVAPKIMSPLLIAAARK